MSVTYHAGYVDDLLGRLDGVLGDASELSLTGLDTDQLNRWLLAMVRLVSQTQGLQATALQEAEAAGLSAAFGSPVLTTHLAKTTGIPAKALAYDRGWPCGYAISLPFSKRWLMGCSAGTMCSS